MLVLLNNENLKAESSGKSSLQRSLLLHYNLMKTEDSKEVDRILKLKVSELKKECQVLDISSTGLKVELQLALLKYYLN